MNEVRTLEIEAAAASAHVNQVHNVTLEGTGDNSFLTPLSLGTPQLFIQTHYLRSEITVIFFFLKSFSEEKAIQDVLHLE